LISDSHIRARCPICRKAGRLPDADTRKYYRAGYLIHHLEGRPEWIAWVIDAEGLRSQRALFRKWASVCRDCQNAFIETRSSPLWQSLDGLVHALRRKIRTLESDLSSLRLQVGAVEGARDHVARVRDNAKERAGAGLADSGYVYAVADGKHIKIGWAKNLDKRLGELQISSPRDMRLLGSVIGFRHDERRIQERFSQYHVRGEWYRDVPSIREFFGALSAAADDIGQPRQGVRIARLAGRGRPSRSSNVRTYGSLGKAGLRARPPRR
jgi:hypothetical protein